GAPDNPPLTYKLVPRFTQSGSAVVSVVHVVSVNPETTVCQIKNSGVELVLTRRRAVRPGDLTDEAATFLTVRWWFGPSDTFGSFWPEWFSHDRYHRHDGKLKACPNMSFVDSVRSGTEGAQP